MAANFIVEDGTVVANANAYVTVAFVDQYVLDAGGQTAWDAALDSAKQIAIVKATRYIDMLFGKKFRSRRRDRLQKLEWPRQDIYFSDGNLWINDDEIPQELQEACAEYATEAISAELIESSIAKGKNRQVDGETKVVGPITTSTQYTNRSRISGSVPDSAFKTFPKAEMIIAPLLASASSGELVRM